MKGLLISLLVTILAAAGDSAEPVRYHQQSIPINVADWYTCSLLDMDGDGRKELFALIPAQRKVLLFRQHQSGFVTNPTQVITLPAETAWVALQEVAPEPKQELVISTAEGVKYLPQTNGNFDVRPRSLISAHQVNTGSTPIFLVLPGQGSETNLIPVIERTHATLYQQDSSHHWQPVLRQELKLAQTSWYRGDNEWNVGQHQAGAVHVRRRFLTQDEHAPVPSGPPEEPIRQALEELRRDKAGLPASYQRQDINGDGQEDVVVWKCHGDIDPRTYLSIFLRGRDGKLPAKATQTLRARGWPVRVGPKQVVSPMLDLDGDGVCELLLCPLRTRISSWSSLVDLALSQGVDWDLTIRTSKGGMYSNNPDASLEISTMLAPEEHIWEQITVNGNFNDDGRPDLVVRRSVRRYDIFLSRVGRGYFEPKAGWVVDCPSDAYLHVEDLNRDGFSDLWIQSWEEKRVVVFLSQEPPTTGRGLR